MTELWPHLLRPVWLLALPLLLWLCWRLWQRQRRHGRWERLLPPAFQPLLLSGRRGRDDRLPWLLLGLGWLLAVLALAGPAWQRLESGGVRPVDPLVVMLEVTPAMLAGDASPNRLELAKRKLLDLLRSRAGAETAVVVFAGSAHTLVPLSRDLPTTANLLQAVQPAIMPEAGHRADLAVSQALALLQQGGLGRGRLLLIASTLGEAEQQAITEQLADRPFRLSVLGIGSSAGAPIRQPDGSLLRDARGNILLPRLDSHRLGQLAALHGGRYQHARPDPGDLQALALLGGASRQAAEGEEPARVRWSDQGHWLLLPLLLLAACAGRRGWLLAVLPLALLPAQPSHALDWPDLWLRPDQQGQRLLQAGRPADAARRFEDSQWRALAAYQAGDYAAAATLFGTRDSAAAHYNRGNALAHADQLQAALEAYDQALELQPDLEQARHNRRLVEQLLQQRQAAEHEQASPSTPPEQAGQTHEHSASQATQQGESSARPASPSAATPPPSAEERPAADSTPEQADTAPTADGIGEQQQEVEQWLRQIPDDPGELLRQKFLYEQRQRRNDRP